MAVERLDDIDDDECLVVLFRTPIVKESTRSGLKKQQDNNNVGNLTVSSVFGYSAADVDNNCNVDNAQQHQLLQQQNRNNNNYNGLTFLPNGPVNLPFLPNSSSNNLRILHAQSGLLIAATGFSPDVDHILNVAAGRVFSRISVYDAPSFISSSSSTSGKSVDPHRLVREDLSSMMIDAAMSEGARPLGIQLLVIGQSSLSSKGSNNSLEIYTIDPSGGFRSCIGRGTAIGRGAQRVCSSLMNEEKLNNNNYGWRGALDRAMLAAVDALESTDEDGDVIEKEHSKYGVVVVLGKASSLNSRVSTTSTCASVDSAIVEECYQRCCEHKSSKKQAT